MKFEPMASRLQKSEAYAAVDGRKLRGYGLVRGLEHVALGRGVAPEQAVQRLNELPFVEFAEPDYELYADTNDTYFDLQWGLDNAGQDIRGTLGVIDADIDAPEAWSTATGDPQFIVAVIDTGTDYTHVDLAGNIWTNPGEIPGNGVDDDGNGFIDDVHGYDFYANDGDPMDEDGHGTHVAGTICAETNNAEGVAGVAWNCRIMPLRFLGPFGGSTSAAIQALDYAVMMGAMVSNNSWGGGGFSQSLYLAIQNAGAAGHLFVAAAGNSAVDNDATPHYPSSYDLDNIISVAATDNTDNLSSFSNYGLTSVDVGAPGTDIASTYVSPYLYVWASGTSMASPHVTGLAALVWDLNPGWTALQVKSRILNTARPLDALSGKTVTGGMINAFDALYSPTTSPDAPSDLVAAALSDTEIELLWADNADNEDSYRIERSTDGGATWAEIGTAGVNATSYTDTGLEGDTTYHFQVLASNPVGDSGYSNVASATTDPTPVMQVVTATGETPVAGTVSGSYEDTWVADSFTQSITERESGGRKPSRHSYLEHIWIFDPVPAGVTTLDIVSSAGPSSDGDFFEFAYSINGAGFVTMADPATDFPPDAVGTVEIRVVDTDRTSGNRSLDTVHVDYIAITSYMDAESSPPAAPSGLVVDASGAYQVDLIWTDNSGDELGFRVERSSDSGANWEAVGTTGQDATSYSDATVSPDTAYVYRVFAYNAGGDSLSSNEVPVTTDAASAIDLTTTSYKDKGWHNVDLDWSEGGPAGPFDVFRNDDVIASAVSATSYFDGAIDKGSASYTYQVCPANVSPPDTSCSNSAEAVF